MAFPWPLLLQMLPAVVGGVQQLFGGSKPPTMPTQQLMSWDQAMAAAQSQMQPALQQYDNQATQRGFYGQMPTDAYRNSWAAGQQAQLANQLMQQTANMLLQQGQLNLANWQAAQQARSNNFQNFLGGLGTAWQGYKDWADLTGNLPFTGGKHTLQHDAAVASQLIRGGYQPAQVTDPSAVNYQLQLGSFYNPHG